MVKTLHSGVFLALVVVDQLPPDCFGLLNEGWLVAEKVGDRLVD